MEPNKSFFSDLTTALFSPKRFFTERFLTLPSKRIFFLSNIGVFFGILLGSLCTVWFANVVIADFATNSAAYAAALKTLSLNEEGFLDLMRAQRAYSVVLALLSPVIAFGATHILGGALFIFLWLLVRPHGVAITFHEVLECTAASLTSVAFYMIPGVGPIIASALVAINLSRALAIRYKLVGFMKAMSILSAMYICSFLTSASLQLLAVPVAKML